MRHNITLAFTILALFLSVYFFYGSSYIIYSISVIIFIYLILIISGSGLIQLNYFVKSINKGSNKGIAITFDDGPDPEITPKILDSELHRIFQNLENYRKGLEEFQ